MVSELRKDTKKNYKSDYGTVLIQYNANGGSDAPSSHTTTKDSESVVVFNLSSEIPTRSGYTFLGWRYEDSEEYGIDAPGQEIVFELGNPTLSETITYYAQWVENDS